MKSDMFFDAPQPQYVWKLVTSALVITLLYIFISHNYHFMIYIDAFISFVVGIIDIIFKLIEIRNLYMRKRKIVWFSHKFLQESGFLPLCFAVILLGWGLVLKGSDVLVLVLGFPGFIVLLYTVIVEIRALRVAFGFKVVEDSNKDKIDL